MYAEPIDILVDKNKTTSVAGGVSGLELTGKAY
jgi:hypothetical protein